VVVTQCQLSRELLSWCKLVVGNPATRRVSPHQEAAVAGGAAGSTAPGRQRSRRAPEGALATIDTEQLLVPITDACDVLGGVSRPTLYGLVNAGQRDLVKIGTRSFITAKSLRDFVDRKLRQSTEAVAGDA
jgi:hypothetical protein